MANQSKTHSGSSIVRILVSAAIIIGAAWIFLNIQWVVDQVRVLTYTPSPEITQLAQRSQMRPSAERLWYASHPEVQEREVFNASCRSNERTIVLGCYRAQRIYIFNITDPRFSGIKEVTAAHEMLHAAYERMSRDERAATDALLRPIIDTMTDPRILELIELYNREEPGELYNEMHSILGTEYAALTPELEDYYKRYFKDRQIVVGFAGQYQAVFTESQNKIDEYDGQLAAMKPVIDANNQTLQQMESELEAMNSQLSAYRAQNQYQQYNTLAVTYNAKVATFNGLIQQTKTVVAQYNDIVAKRNEQAAAQTNLYDSIDSKYQTTQTR